MPINRKLMANLKREYGSAKGERVYYAMEANNEIAPPKAKPLNKKPISKRGRKP